MSLLDCQKIAIGVNGRRLLSAFDWQIESGQCWGILGANGCGKSTLLKSIAGLHPLQDGNLTIDGIRRDELLPKQLARKLGMLPQETPFRFPVAVLDLVIAGRYPWQSWYARLSQQEYRVAADALASLDAQQLQKRHADTLSGGEARKVAMAILLCQSPQLALLDEPENHLDPGMRYRLIERLKQHFTTDEKALVMVLHDPALALHFCTHLLMIESEGTVAAGTVQELATAERISAVYGHRMCLTSVDGRRLVYPE